ncbi:MAG: PAS domain-containing protein, partial [Candidatus Hydrogenedentes bacterium]|nr:PAS domain-containing protein [Candidatus Hydrogenedentota bacterium]
SATFNEMAASLRALRRHDQQEIIHSQLAAEEVFRHFPGAVVMTDLHERIRFVTPAAEGHFKLHAGNWLDEQNEPWLKALHERALHEDRAVETREDQVIQRFRDGKEYFFQPVAIPTHNPSRQQTGVLIDFRDVTQLRGQEELKRGVIATVSHQIKTPLTSIRMALHLLLGEGVGPLNAKQEELLLAAREDSDRLGQMLEELLNIGKLRAGKDALNIQPVPAARLIQNAEQEFAAPAADKGLQLREELPEDLPQILVDEERIAHVFRNLISNAIRYTDPGGSICLSAAPGREGMVTFTVSDTGSGIPPEAKDRVFEQFYRVPGQERNSGVGLGLAIVREIVAAHGGEVGVESTHGEGSQFWFTIPSEETA